MTGEEFRDRQFEISFTAGINQRYHQARESFWTSWDRGVKVLVGVLAVAGLCITVYTTTPQGATWIQAGVCVAIFGAFSAIALNVLPIGEWAKLHNALFQKWTDLREDVDALLFDLSGEPSDELKDRLKALEAKVHRICGSEPGCKKHLLQQCCNEEKRSRGLKDTTAELCPSQQPPIAASTL